MPELPCLLVCPRCPTTVEAGEEDPDAALSEMHNHLYWDHALKGGRDATAARSATRALLAQVTTRPLP